MSVNVTKTEGKAPEKVGTSPSTMRPLMGLREDFDRLFDGFLAAPFGRLLETDPFRRLAAYGGGLAPRMDVRETEAAFEVSAELPGVAEADIDVTVTDRLLTIRAEKKEEHEENEGAWHMTERRYGTFARTMELPPSVDEAGISAEFDRGVLRLTMPKKAEAEKKAKKIEVATKH